MISNAWEIVHGTDLWVPGTGVEGCRHLLPTLQGTKSLVQAGKGKGHPRTGHEGPEVEQRYSSTLSLTLALDEVGG